MKKFQSATIEGGAWSACYDKFLKSWNKIELMPGTWEDKFKEAFTYLFVEANKSMKDPKIGLTAESILVRRVREIKLRNENCDVLL